MIPPMIPFQKEMLDHESKTGHEFFTVTGTKKKEKLRGVYCKICKKYISKIKFLSSKKRRR